jgi:hypothetical protein
MKNAIISIGGSSNNLSWTHRASYICVGMKNLSEGNAFHEAFDNLSSDLNNYKS